MSLLFVLKVKPNWPRFRFLKFLVKILVVMKWPVTFISDPSQVNLQVFKFIFNNYALYFSFYSSTLKLLHIKLHINILRSFTCNKIFKSVFEVMRFYSIVYLAFSTQQKILTDSDLSIYAVWTSHYLRLLLFNEFVSS